MKVERLGEAGLPLFTGPSRLANEGAASYPQLVERHEISSISLQRVTCKIFPNDRKNLKTWHLVVYLLEAVCTHTSA